MQLHASGEDYLETLLILQNQMGYVRSVDLARYMGYAKPSVSHAVSILREGGYITVDADYSLHLTESGRKIAEKIYERHQFFTNMLVKMGVSRDTAAQDACRIEHCISDESFEKLKETLRQ